MRMMNPFTGSLSTGNPVRFGDGDKKNPDKTKPELQPDILGRKKDGINEYKGWYRTTRHDFDKYVKESEAKHFTKDDFPWDLDVKTELRKSIDSLSDDELLALAKQALPVVEDYPPSKLRTLETHGLPKSKRTRAALKETIVERQFQALYDITNHALVAEQSSVAPLSKGIVRYSRYPRLQEAITTFVRDEAKHSGIFEKYMHEKLGGQEKVSKDTVVAFKAFSQLAKASPAASVFLALAVETVGGSFFEFFKDHAPDPLFREMCRKIYENDERRHMEIVTDLYNEHYRKGGRWEEMRNNNAMKAIVYEVYGKSAKPDHYLMQACAAFGVDPQELMDHISKRVEENFAKIGFTWTMKDFSAE